MDKSGRDNRSNQMNPNNSAYSSSRGGSNTGSSGRSQQDYDNRSNQLNPNNSAYYSSRGGQKK
ncbi:hypothetical protein TcasGA2_TC007601 [Tribolium castaneum]|uniref:Uncharacterized protein n=1 Tax=Tribolium castaneum TaxID=7070 RepID=D2A2Z4_TRICA|nr:PREDICTED: uncharacterized protein LOC661756 [Tribolium castaneum]EFA01980.1 hypothetical protein TcasGA2_TC007601 [Tribolium castaneum]|eukprot:XP_976394.1 PREDICTED: uncharacterized protein LOC661756 [Tribolium castaneum]